jgi:hypothetical protein
MIVAGMCVARNTTTIQRNVSFIGIVVRRTSGYVSVEVGAVAVCSFSNSGDGFRDGRVRG